MLNDMDRYYRSSGRVPFSGILLMQAAGALVAALAGAVYAAIDWWNPFIYVTFLATFGFGFVTGYAVSGAARIGKVRSRMFTALIGTAAGVLALYFAWVFYIYFGSGLQFWAWNPLQIIGIMGDVMEEPVWSMRGFEPPGWMLALIWLLEAGIVIGTAAVTALADDKPFCDPCDTWTETTVCGAAMPLTDPEALRRDLEAENYGVLDDLMAEPASPTNFYQATIHSCPQCEESNFLTVAHVTITTDSDGDLQTNVEPIIRHLRIPFELAEHLKTAEGAEEVVVAPEDDGGTTEQAEDKAAVVDFEDGPPGQR